MHGEGRRLYREMLEEGYDPNRGLAPLYAVIIVTGLVAMIVSVVAFARALGATTSIFDNIFNHFMP